MRMAYARFFRRRIGPNYAGLPIPTKAPVYYGIIPPGDSEIMAPPFYEMIPPRAPRSLAAKICLTCSGFWSSVFGSFAASAA